MTDGNVIQAGDLAVIVKPTACCGDTTYLGLVFKVAAIGPSLSDGTYCQFCLHVEPQHVVAFCDDGDCLELNRLKRIPPLDELEGGYESYSGYRPMKEPA